VSVQFRLVQFIYVALYASLRGRPIYPDLQGVGELTPPVSFAALY